MAGEFRIDGSLVQPELGVVIREDKEIPLRPKEMEVLRYLVERQGEIVPAEEIIEAVWKGTFVTNEVLTNAISSLRKAFSDDARDPSFIQTHPRKGYRLIATVSFPQDNGEVSPTKRFPLKPTGWILFVLFIGLMSLWYSLFWDRAEYEDPVIVPFTTDPGQEFYPRFSPDGKMIAYVKTLDPDRSEIYVRRIDGRESIPLTQGIALDIAPVWSPNGDQIAFLRFAGEKSGIFKVETLGGGERELLPLKYHDDRFIRHMFNNNWGLSWSSNGELLVFPDQEVPEGPFSLHLLSLRTRQKSMLTFPPAHTVDAAPQFSPDGSKVAFRRGPVHAQDVFVIGLAGGEPTGKPKPVTQGYQVVGDLAWTADGKEILFSSRQGGRTGSPALWKVAVSGGSPQRVWAAGQGVLYPAVSPDGNRLAYLKTTINSDIYRVELAGRNSIKPPVPIVDSTAVDVTLRISPDGKKIAFASEKTGRLQIYVCDSDGSNEERLTDMSAFDTSSPSWSPKGDRIAFNSKPGGNFDIYTINAKGGPPQRLTSHSARDFNPAWSPDGRWIYFHSWRTGSPQIWRIQANGEEGEAEQVTSKGGMVPEVSLDGKDLYYFKPYKPTEAAARRYVKETGHPSRGAGAIWRMPVTAGEEKLVLDHIASFAAWTLTARGIYTIDSHTKRHPSVRFLDFETGKERRVAVLPENTRFGGGRWISVSPTDDWLVYMTVDIAEDIMLMENFR